VIIFSDNIKDDNIKDDNIKDDNINGGNINGDDINDEINDNINDGIKENVNDDSNGYGKDNIKAVVVGSRVMTFENYGISGDIHITIMISNWIGLYN